MMGRTLSILFVAAASVISATSAEAAAPVATHGTFVAVDEPHAGDATGQGTFVTGINDRGVIVGNYSTSKNLTHSFRYSDGEFVEFNDPRAGSGPFQGTDAIDLNDWGAIAGYYLVAPTSSTGSSGVQVIIRRSTIPKRARLPARVRTPSVSTTTA